MLKRFFYVVASLIKNGCGTRISIAKISSCNKVFIQLVLSSWFNVSCDLASWNNWRKKLWRIECHSSKSYSFLLPKFFTIPYCCTLMSVSAHLKSYPQIFSRQIPCVYNTTITTIYTAPWLLWCAFVADYRHSCI